MNIVQNDYGYDMNFAVTDSSDNIVNLSGGSVYFNVANRATLGSLFSKLCVTDVAESGTCHYTIAGSDFTQVGTYVWQLSAVWSGLKIQTYDATEPINVVRKIV
jgi:hypothetical protein